MTDWDARQLTALAPNVDEAKASAAFRRSLGRHRRRRRIVVATVAASIAAVVALAALRLVDPKDGTGVDVGPAETPEKGWQKVGPVPDERSSAIVVPGDGAVLVWGGVREDPANPETTGPTYPPNYKGYTGKPVVDGHLFDTATRTWTPVPDAPVPFLGFEAIGAWTGTEFLVWGHDYENLGPQTTQSYGALYDPAKKSWRPMARQTHVVLSNGVWTGTHWVVAGNGQAFSDSRAAAYDPKTDTWRTLDDPPLLDSANVDLLGWTGEEVVAVDSVGIVAVGDLTTGKWRRAAPGPFSERRASRFVWAGTGFVQLGGGRPVSDTIEEEGGAAFYDVAADRWQVLDNPPAVRDGVAFGDGAQFFGAGTWHFHAAERTFTRAPDPPGAVRHMTADEAGIWALAVEDRTPGAAWTAAELLRYTA